MKSITIKPFHVIGISIRTTNENNQSSKDIFGLWNRFLSENLISKIPNKKSKDVYSIYTDYEKDHTKPYTTILGCEVENLDNIPTGFIGKSISGGQYNKFTAKGKLSEQVVFNEWVKIWNADIKRAFEDDFEVYGEKAGNPDNVEVDIFVKIIE